MLHDDTPKQPRTQGLCAVRNRRCAQYDRKAVWEHNLQILQGMLTHLQLWVSLAFSLFLFPLILITFCIIISKRSVWC